VSVSLRVELESSGRVSVERADTLSCGGLRLLSSRPLEPNASIGLRFRLDEDSSAPVIAARGRVIYCQPRTRLRPAHAVGVVFTDLDAPQRELVAAAVDRILSRPDERGAR
jgi:hypothetical protein